jgi:TatD DNase family protein
LKRLSVSCFDPLPMEFVDTHCHLNDEAFEADRDQARERARVAGVTRMLCIGADLEGSRRAVALTALGAELYAAIGLHPEAAAAWDAEVADEMRGLCASCPQVIAYGEIGLDYHWETVPHERQQIVFAEQIAFAASISPTLPLVIHCRDAQEDTLAILRESGTTAPVIFHCFTGDIASSRPVLDAGYFLGIGGVVTFKKSEALRAAVTAAPLERLLLETDCPYLAPQPWRGRRNEPSYLPAVAETVATIRNTPLAEVAAITTANAQKLFGW